MSNESAVRSVLQYIRDNLNEDLTLEKIAKELNYSRFYIARVIRILAESTGKTEEELKADTDRDYYMSAAEALEYG